MNMLTLVLALAALVALKIPALAAAILCAILIINAIPLFKGGYVSPKKEEREESEGDVSQEVMQERSQREALTEIGKTSAGALGIKHHIGQWQQFEEQLTLLYKKYALLIEERLHPQTVAIYLPSSETGFHQRYHITTSPHFSAQASIELGEDLIGCYLKKGLTEANINELSSTQDLPYYKKKGQAGSLIMVPLVALKASGFIIVDSQEAGKFTEQDMNWLREIGLLLGTNIYYGYLYQQHRLLHEEAAAVNERARRFITTKSVENLIDEVVSVFKEAFAFDRLSLSRRDDSEEVGRIIFAEGIDAEKLLNKSFSLSDHALVNIFYSNRNKSEKPQILARTLSTQSYEYRYSQSEPRTPHIKSFVALPLGVGEIRSVLLVESCSDRGYSQKDIENMARIADTVSIALEKMILLQQQENLAIRDGLTGLYNHRHFESLLQETIARSHRLTRPDMGSSSDVEKVPVALIICDIDHFKSVNDTHGHSFGDHVLEAVASALERGIRQGVDFAARYGGEEFALILYDNGPKQAAETAERLRASIEALRFKTQKGEDFSLTMSFGIAFYDRDAKRKEELVQKADKALYRAKESGRNRVELYSLALEE